MIKRKITQLISIIALTLILTSSIPMVNALTFETTLLVDGFEGTIWNANWPTDSSLWYDETDALRVRTGSHSATSAGTAQDGLFTSVSMDTSDATSIYVEFWFRKYATEDLDIVLYYWDGTSYVLIDYLDDNGLDQQWIQYSHTITDSKYFISDFKIRFETILGSSETFAVDDVYITKTVEVDYQLSLFTEGHGTILVDLAGPYDPGTPVELTPVPDTGWAFSHWEDDLTGTTSPETLIMDEDKQVTAIFVDITDITVSMSAASYNYDNNMVVRIRNGNGGGDVMIQISLGSAVKWADQRTLDPSGNMDYTLKIPSVWGQGTFTVRVKDVEGGTTASTTYVVPVPTPPTPPSGGGGSGGGGVVLPSPVVIASLSPKDAAALLDDFGPTDIAAVLSSVTNNEHVAKILEAFNPDLAIKVLEKMPQQKALGYLRLMSDESVLNLILGFDETNKDLMQSLVDDDFERVAGLVEEAIKTRAEGLSDEARKEALEKLASAVSALDKQSLMDLLVYIAKLPETPATVAYMLESMSLSTVLDVVSTWLMDTQYLEARADLIAVLQEVSTSLLGDVYIGITNAERMVLYPYLTSEQVAELPEIGEFQSSNLVASPSEIKPDEQVTVSYTITNTGDQADRYVVPLKINGLAVETDSGLLDSGASVDFTHVFTRSQTGTYTVEVLGKSATFQVLVVQPPPKPADLKAANIEVIPSTVIQGETVSVFITVRNSGELQGTASFTLRFDSIDTGSKQATLAAGDSMTLLYELIADYTPGTHQINVGELTATLTVQEKPQQFPWYTASTVIIILAALGVYIYLRRSQQL